MNRGDLANLIRSSRNSWATIETAQVFAVGTMGHLSICMVIGGDDTAVTTFRDGDATGTIIRTVSTGVGTNVPSGDLYFVNGLHVTITQAGSNVIVMGAGQRGALTTPPAIFTPTPPAAPGEPSGVFDGTSGFTDFSEYAPGDGQPSQWTEQPTRGITSGTFRILTEGENYTGYGDATNDNPLGGQSWYMNTPNEQPWCNYYWNLVADGLGGSGEILALIKRHESTTGVPYMGVAMAQKQDKWVTWTPQTINFTRGYVFTGSWYTSQVPGMAANQWAWLRYRRSSDYKTHQAKLWDVGVSEPGSWLADVTRANDDGHTGGRVGIMGNMYFGATVLGGFQMSYYAFTTDPTGTPLAVPTST